MGVRLGFHIVAVIVAASAPPSLSFAADLVYNHRKAEELPVLRNYDKQPYWRGLAECAGMHGVLATRFRASGDDRLARAALDQGVGFFRAATLRLRSDRGLSESEARLLTEPAVDAGRSSADALLQVPVDRGYTHEQIVQAMCSQLTERHAEAARQSRR